MRIKPRKSEIKTPANPRAGHADFIICDPGFWSPEGEKMFEALVYSPIFEPSGLLANNLNIFRQAFHAMCLLVASPQLTGIRRGGDNQTLLLQMDTTELRFQILMG